MLREVEIVVDATAADALSDALVDAGALAVTLLDADADTPAEQALFGEPGGDPAAAWLSNRIQVLIDAATDPQQLLMQAAALAAVPTPQPLAIRTVADADWVRATQQQFAPIAIGKRLWIVPSWHAAPDPDALIVHLDPGVAFGTGSHPTTSLCLRWLEQNLTGGALLDYGCGSGILSIAAARLGAAPVVGVDIDPQALTAARANALRNGVDARYTAPDELSCGAFDVVVANILTNPLTLLAPVLTCLTRPGGRLVLSGILERQAEDVAAAYRAVRPYLALRPWATDQGWVCLTGYLPTNR